MYIFHKEPNLFYVRFLENRGDMRHADTMQTRNHRLWIYIFPIIELPAHFR